MRKENNNMFSALSVCVCHIMALRRTLHCCNHHQLPGNREKPQVTEKRSFSVITVTECAFVCVFVHGSFHIHYLLKGKLVQIVFFPPSCLSLLPWLLW